MRRQGGMRDELLPGEAAQIGPVLAEHDFDRFHPDGIDLRCMDPAHSVSRLPLRLLPAFFDRSCFVGVLQRWRGLAPLLFSFHLAELPQNLLFMSGPVSCPVPPPAPTVVYPPAALADLAPPTPRAAQSNKSPCSPSRPTLPVALSATPLSEPVPQSWSRSWLFLDPLPSGVGAHTQCRSLPRSIPATFRPMSRTPPGAVFCCCQSSQHHRFLPSCFVF